MRTLELLAPAKNLEYGKIAIAHGADAVYIGASKFGARAAVGNSVSDIHELCNYAHQFGAKVYVTVNTIIYENEIEETKALLRQLCQIKVDALLVQDMAILNLLPKGESIPALHASTQTDNRTADKVEWLQSIGFERAVLARELSLNEIKSIHKQVPNMQLEAFVHGALCVSYSGVCYASQYCFNRSANRGACAQFCRMKFDLLDACGNEIIHQRHLLSLKDLCQINELEALADAGVCSFKIEGRLKGIEYVKNVVSAYSKRLDSIIKKRANHYQRASLGRVTYAFEPNLRKTFNRGYTNYFLHHRQADIYSPLTPKALGEYVGKVKHITHNSFNVSGTASFANGDGLCFVNAAGELEGFRINKAEGNKLYPLYMPAQLKQGMPLYRNNDEAFSKILAGKTAERKIPISFILSVVEKGFCLTARAKEIKQVSHVVEIEKQQAQKPQKNNIVQQLSKLGNTPYIAANIDIQDNADNYFIPSSVLTTLRRKVIEQIQVVNTANTAEKQPHQKPFYNLVWQPAYQKFPYIYNISNTQAKAFYQQQGLTQTTDAYEVSKPNTKQLLMQCRHCIRYSLGYCALRGGKQPNWKEPLSLRLGDGRRFRLEFQCNLCQMNIYADE